MKYLILFLVLVTTAFAEAPLPLSFQDQPKEIVVNNRILLKVNGKPITLMDVVKKMDYIFYRQFPHLSSSLEARYQFYNVNFRHFLNTVINDQLVVLDAEEKKVEVTDGDVRETLEELFGPEVVLNLDKLGLSYEETWEILKTELTVQKMVAMMVRSKAMQEVYPKEVKKLYQKFLRDNPNETVWIYQTATVQPKGNENVLSVAEQAKDLLENQKVAFSELASNLNQEVAVLKVSEEYTRKDKELSQAHKEVLESLGKGCFSSPILQKTKQNEDVYRIFYLKDKIENSQLKFSEKAQELESNLTTQAMAKYNEEYVNKLREHYGMTREYLEMLIPDNFQPFCLK